MGVCREKIVGSQTASVLGPLKSPSSDFPRWILSILEGYDFIFNVIFSLFKRSGPKGSGPMVVPGEVRHFLVDDRRPAALYLQLLTGPFRAD